MPSPHFQPRSHPQLFALLHRILQRARLDLPESLGLTISVHGKRYSDGPALLAAWGPGSEIVTAQLSGLGGPLPDALRYEVPVLSVDLWSDDRWPALTLDALTAHSPQDRPTWERIRGTVVVPGLWADDGNVAISSILDRPATASAVGALINYERLIDAAFVTTAAENTAGIEDMLAVLQSRVAIEQAKGAIMGCLGCDAEQAWMTLRQASQEFNIKARVLAIALLEHISGAPAEQPAFAAPIVPDQSTRQAAQLVWATLSRRREPTAQS
jgi:hypothetical protein